jgi:6-pyruvoyltetrahydropterin/6-carboxytetrahydropterin synthase
METWTITKSFKFEAAHHLPQHDGKCRNHHGHSWKGHVQLQGCALHVIGSKSGMLVDFGDISDCIKILVDKYLDHKDLNVTLGLENPTSEEIARWMWQFIKRDYWPWRDKLVSVTIEETDTSSCTYHGD